MSQRPRIIAFDVVETLFPLLPLERRMEDAGYSGELLNPWFQRILRDAFALSASGDYAPFRDVAIGAFATVAGRQQADAQTMDSLLSGFAELDPHPKVRPAMERARDAGAGVVALSNGASAMTSALLDRAGLSGLVDRVFSVDDVHSWKPSREPYLHAAESCGADPGDVALVAAHGWDVHGAKRAGLTTAWISRLEGVFPDVFAPPDVSAGDLVGAVDGLLGLQDD